MATQYQQEKWKSLLHQYRIALIALGVLLLILLIWWFTSTRSTNQENEALWEQQKKEASQYAQSLGSNAPTQSASPNDNKPTDSPSRSSSLPLPENLRAGIKDYNAYAAVADNRTRYFEKTDKIIDLVFNWNSYATYSSHRSSLINLGVPKDSQLLTTYMPEITDSVKDGVHYNRIDSVGLEKNLSSFSGELAKKHVFPRGDKIVVSANVASGGPQDSKDQHVIVYVTFNKDYSISNVFASDVNILDDREMCLPYGCNDHSETTLAQPGRNKGGVDE